MIKINKNLLTFAGLILLLVISLSVVLQKLLPFARHTIYYCQSVINSFSIPMSHYIGAIPFALLFLFTSAATTKLLFILLKAQLLKSKLISKSRTNLSFALLLKKLQLTNKAYLIESKKPFAFCLGIRNPKIYISTYLVNILSARELEGVLRHERYHLENRDTLTMLIASVGESLLPFFPVFSDFLRNFRVEREIKADAEAIQGLGDEKPLIAVLKKLLKTPSVAKLSIAAIADHDTLKPRILMLVKKDTHFKKFKHANIFISICSLLIMSAITFAPVQAVEVHHQGQDVMMICPHGSSCMSACKQEYSTEKVNHSEDLLYSPMK